ncbi:MAG: hypothetical protein U0521_15485 [Anaerolineae bacterium]
MMLYVNANGLNRVYGLQYDGSRYIAYINGWDGSTLDTRAARRSLHAPGDVQLGVL